MEYEPIWALFQGFEPLFGSKDPDPESHKSERRDSDQLQSDKQDPYPDQSDADPQHWVKAWAARLPFGEDHHGRRTIGKF